MPGAMKTLKEAMDSGQADVDRLPKELKDQALVEAEESLGPQDRIEYKGFRMPVGMLPEQEARWVAAIDRETAPDTPEPKVGGASFGDPTGIVNRLSSSPDASRTLLEAGAILPVGQAVQAGADAGVAGMDLAKGDYSGAAISGAAVVLPFSAAVLKEIADGARKSNAIATDAVEAVLEKDLFKQLEDVPNLVPRNYIGDWNDIIKQYKEKLDLSGLSDEQVEAVFERNMLFNSGKPGSGFDEKIPDIPRRDKEVMNEVFPSRADRRRGGKLRDTVREVSDARYRLHALKDAIGDEWTKRRDAYWAKKKKE